MNRHTAIAFLAGAPSLAKPLLENMVLFDSWGGRYSDNPRAIYETLSKVRSDLNCIWVRGRTNSATFPSGVTTVERNSTEHVRAAHLATHIVTNGHLPRWYIKRRGVTVIQTWHGTPMKRIGLHVAEHNRSGAYNAYLAHVRRDVAKWDVLLSPNRDSSRIFRQAFNYRSVVLEVGSPRNDSLGKDSSESSRRRCAPETNKNRVILVAPTFRDADPAVETRIVDDVLDLARTSHGASIFHLRLHNNSQVRMPSALPPNVINVSAESDLGALMRYADALVTDYSSLMFDFAVTGKPIYFFCPDLHLYRHKGRGFYFDYESVIPRTPAETIEELSFQLGDPTSSCASPTERYERFRRRFCALEDGSATERVISAVWG